MADFLPDGELELLARCRAFSAALTPRVPGFGLLAADLTALDNAIDNFSGGLDGVAAAQSTLRRAKDDKDAARGALETVMRSLNKRLHADPTMTDAILAELGLAVADTSPTPLACPISKPVLVIDTSRRFAHLITFTDTATPRSKARPKGARGCEIWVKLGATPSIAADGSPTDMTFLALDTATPYLAEYPSTDGGKTAYYMARWAGNNGDYGPWSETAEATVVG